MKKKYLVLGVGMLLSLVLCTGCGEKSVIDRMYETSFDSASINAAFDSDIAITAKDPDESTNITSNVEIQGAVSGITNNTFVSQLQGSISYNYADTDEDSFSFKAYYENLEPSEDNFIIGEADVELKHFDVPSKPEDLIDEDAEVAEGNGSSDEIVGPEINTENQVAASDNAASENAAADGTTVYPQIGNSVLYLCDAIEDEDWYYESAYDGDIEYEITLSGVENFKNGIKDVVYKSKKKMGSKKVGNEDCYILQKKLNAADVDVLLQATVDSFMNDYDLETFKLDMEDLLICPVDDFVNMAKPVLNIYVSKENGYFMGADLDLSKISVKQYLKSVEYTMQDFADEIAIESIRNVKVKKAMFTLSLSDINAVNVEVPAEVKEVYEEDWLDLDDFDEWDEEDDEDWEEDDEDDEDWDDEEDEEEEDDEASDDEEDDEDDEDWDDEEDEEEEDDEASDATSVNLYDESGNLLCELKVPESVHYYPDYSEDSCVDFMNSDWTIDCMVTSTIDQGYASYELDEFLFAELYQDEDDDEPFEPTVNYSKEEFSISVLGGKAYYMTGVGEEGPEHYIVIPYTDSEGDTQYVTVSFDENHVEGWERHNYIDFANQMFN